MRIRKFNVFLLLEILFGAVFPMLLLIPFIFWRWESWRVLETIREPAGRVAFMVSSLGVRVMALAELVALWILMLYGPRQIRQNTAAWWFVTLCIVAGLLYSFEWILYIGNFLFSKTGHAWFLKLFQNPAQFFADPRFQLLGVIGPYAICLIQLPRLLIPRD